MKKHTFIYNPVFAAAVFTLCILFSSCGGMSENTEGGTNGSSVPDGMCVVTTSVSCRSAYQAFPSAIPSGVTLHGTVSATINGSIVYLGKDGIKTAQADAYLDNKGTNAAPVFYFYAPSDEGTYTLTVYGTISGTDYASEYVVSGTASLGTLAAGQRNAGTVSISLCANAESTDNSTGILSLSASVSSTLYSSIYIDSSSANSSSAVLTNVSDSSTVTCTIGESSGNTITIAASSVAAGTYTLSLTLKNSSGGALSSDYMPQTVNIYKGFTTDAWYTPEGTKTTLSIGECKSYYVMNDDSTASLSGHVTPNDANSGLSALAPLKTINAALTKILDANDGTSTYYLYLDGTFTDTSTGSYADTNNYAYINIAPSKLLKLVIQSLSSAYPATINAGRNSTNKGRVMYVSDSSVSLTLKNVTLTGGYYENGGGLYVNSGTVTLSDGASITGNTATTSGGGVYVADGTFAMQGSAVVTPTGTGANSVYLASGKSITVSGTLTAAGAAAIQAADCPEKGGTADVLTGTTDHTLTAADCSKFSAYSYTGDPVRGKKAFTGGVYLSSGSAPGTGKMIGFGAAIVVAKGSTATVNAQPPNEESGGPFYNAATTSVTMKPFTMGQYQVTYNLWYIVYQWATSKDRGSAIYTFDNKGQEGNDGSSGAQPTEVAKFEPVTAVNWRDAIVWCNALSEMTGKQPVYCDTSYTSPLRTSAGNSNVPREAGTVDNPYIYAAGVANLDMASCTADGYRLPTEAEWEFAARGGDTTDTTNWNYTYSGSNTIDAVAWYNVDSGNVTHEVGKLNANALRLYDMSGNVMELTWNWYTQWDSRVKRGGEWQDTDVTNCTVYKRSQISPYITLNSGFRVCLSGQ